MISFAFKSYVKLILIVYQIKVDGELLSVRSRVIVRYWYAELWFQFLYSTCCASLASYELIVSKEIEYVQIN